MVGHYKMIMITNKYKKGGIKMNNKQNKIKRFIDITEGVVSCLSQFDLNNIEIEDDEYREVLTAIIELNTMIYVTRELTDINMKNVDVYLFDKLGLGIDELEELEKYLY